MELVVLVIMSVFTLANFAVIIHLATKVEKLEDDLVYKSDLRKTNRLEYQVNQLYTNLYEEELVDVYCTAIGERVEVREKGLVKKHNKLKEIVNELIDDYYGSKQ